METTPPPIHLLPNELLVQIIEKLPRTQWPALELVDHKFRDAVLLAWGSIREVNMEWDFIYSDLKAVEDYGREHNYRRQIARKMEAILKKLSERSPFITTMSGLSFNVQDPSLNTMAVQYLSGFEHLETIKFAQKYFSSRIVIGGEFHFWRYLPFISFIEFLESTQSRATLKEIDIGQSSIDVPNIVANIDRLRAAFVNIPTRQSLQLESFSMEIIGEYYPHTLFDAIDGSRMTKLSLGDSPVDPTTLTNMINGAPQLHHIDFGFLDSCEWYDNAPACQGGRLQQHKDLLAALGSLPSLTSLGFNRIWNDSCACHRFEAEFKTMLRMVGPKLVNFLFKPGVSYIRMGEVRDIIQHHMPQLKSITLDGQDGPFSAVYLEELRGIADGKELEEIKITNFHYSDDGLTTIIMKSHQLKRFSLLHHHPNQRVMVELCKLSNLIDLRTYAVDLTEENFVDISKQAFAEKLQVLHLYHLQEGMEVGWIELIKYGTQLRELVACGTVTDRLLECLAESCPNLEKFDAMWAKGIPFNVVQNLVDRCPKLRWLRLGNTDVTRASSLRKNLKLDRYRKLEFNL